MSAAVLEGEERVNSVSVDGLVSFNRIMGAISVRSGPSGDDRPTDRPTDHRNFNVMERDKKKRKGPIAFICVTPQAPM